jgi:hypothetical protein
MDDLAGSGVAHHHAGPVDCNGEIFLLHRLFQKGFRLGLGLFIAVVESAGRFDPGLWNTLLPPTHTYGTDEFQLLESTGFATGPCELNDLLCGAQRTGARRMKWAVHPHVSGGMNNMGARFG